MTKLSETKCSGCSGTGYSIHTEVTPLTNKVVSEYIVCPMCNGKRYEKETVGGYAPVAAINHEGRE